VSKNIGGISRLILLTIIAAFGLIYPAAAQILEREWAQARPQGFGQIWDASQPGPHDMRGTRSPDVPPEWSELDRERQKAEKEDRGPQAELVRSSPAAKVSAEELRHPLTGRARKLLSKAETLFRAGDRARAREELRKATEDTSAAPYAFSMLGESYLRDGQPSAAVAELEHASLLMPLNVPIRANLGLALLQTGDHPRAERELRRAFELEPSNPQTSLVLGVVLLDTGNDKDGLERIRFAGRTIPSAHMVLAAYFGATGRMEMAEQEARTFLGPERSSDPMKVREWVTQLAHRTVTTAGSAPSASEH